MLESTRLGYLLLALVFEKYSRFSEYLEGVAVMCTPEETPLVHFFEKTAAMILSKDVVRPYQLLSSDEDEASTLAVGQLIGASGNIDALLVSTNVFPRGRPYAEVYEFIQRLFPNVLSADELTIELWPELNFASEPDLRRELVRRLTVEPPGNGKHVVLYLAEVEHANPLAWSLLTHEVGHVVVEELQLRRHVFQDRNLRNQSKEIDSLEDWAEEILSDLIAVRALGPAYFFSLATFGMQAPDFGTDWGGAPRSHPPLHQRLQALKEHLDSILQPATDPAHRATTGTPDSLPLLQEIVDHYHSHVSKRADLKGAPDKPIYSDIWVDLVGKSIQVINDHSDALPCFSRQDFCNAKDLSDLMGRGLPIGSQLEPAHRQDIRNVLAMLKNEGIDAGKRTEQLERVLAQFDENPLEVPLIVNAGWLHRSKFLHAWVEKIQAEDLDSDAAFQRIWSTIKRSDQLLRKSLESSAVIRLFDQGQRFLEQNVRP